MVSTGSGWTGFFVTEAGARGVWRWFAWVLAAAVVFTWSLTADLPRAEAVGRVTDSAVSQLAKAKPAAKVSSRPDVVSAGVTARSQGSRVEADSLRTDFTSTFVNPDGTLTTTASTGQVRFKDAAGSWKNVELKMADADGRVVAASTPEQVTLAGSSKSASGTAKVASDQAAKASAGSASAAADGSDVLGASVGKDRQVVLGWDRKLDAPKVAGAVATYVDAAPGVDLQVRLTRSGYQTFFVVKDRAAVARSVAAAGPAKGRLAFDFPVKTKGLSARAEKDGSVAFVDAKGKVVSRLVAPEAWDAKVDEASGLPAARTPVRLDVVARGKGKAVVTVSVGAAWAQDAARTFPLTVDPTYASVTVVPGFDTRVQTDGGTLDYSGDTELRVGTFDGGTTVARSYLNFPVAPIAGKQIISGSLSLYEVHSFSCTAKRMDVLKTGAASTSTRWGNQPTSAGVAGSATFAKGFSSSCPAGRQSINVTQLVKDLAGSGWVIGTVGLQATSETDSYGWKRFSSSETANPPYLSVTYNRAPNNAAAPTFLASGTYSGVGYVRGPRITFSTKASDADASQVKSTIEVHSGTTGTGKLGECTTGLVASGSTMSCVPAVDLPNGATSYVRAKTTDELGLSSTSWSGWTTIRRAGTAPSAPSVSCPGFTNGSWSDTAPAADVVCTISTSQTGVFAPVRVDVYVDGAATPTKVISANQGAASTTVSFPKAGNGGHEVRAVAVGPSNLSASSTVAFGWGGASLSSPVPLSTTSGKVTFSAVGPPKGGATSVTAKVRWRVAGQGGNETTGWVNGGTLPVTFTSAGLAQASGVWDTQQATTDAAGVTIPARTPVLLDVQVCLAYGGASQCTWSQTSTSISRVPHAFGAGYPTADAGPGQVAQFTGEFNTSATDGSVPGLTGALSISRSHLTFTGDGSLTGWPSADLANSVFGPGWTGSWDGPDAGTGSLQLVDNTGMDGTMVLVDEDGAALVFQQPGETRVKTKAGEYEPVTQESVDAGLRVVVSGTGTAARVVVTEEDSTATTYSPVTTSAPAAWTWVPLQVAEPGTAGTTTYARDAAGRVIRILGGLPDGFTAADCPTTGGMQPGCRALTVTYATTTTASGAIPGDISGQVKQVSAVLWDPATSTMKTTPIATYIYDSSKRLVKVTDPRTNLATQYGWDGATTRLASITPPGQAAYRITYDGAATAGGRVKQITRDAPEAGASAAALASFVYGVSVDPVGEGKGNQLPLPTLSKAKTDVWHQSTTPTTGFAVFGPEHPVSSTDPAQVGLDDWDYADVAYTDAQGYEVNSASYGAGQWLLTSTDYDAKGNPVRELTPEAISAIQALGAPVKEVADTLSTQNVYNADVKNAAGEVVTPAGTLLIDSLDPVREITLPDGRQITARIKSHTTYDEGAPNGNVNPVSSGPYNLPTTVTTSVVGTDPGAGGAGDVELTKVTNGYAPVESGDTSGWDLGNATKVTQAGITSATRYDPAGRVIETRQPAATTTASAGTTRTIYYTAGTNTADASCGASANAKAWAGSVCRILPGAAPSAGAPLPESRSAGYDMWLSPTVVIETGGSTTRTSTTRYDVAGRETWERTTSTLPGAVARPATFTKYNAATGLVDYEGVSNAPGTDATEERTSSTYDGWGREVTYANDQGEETITTYDAAGRVATVVDPKGAKTYTYDGTDVAGKVERRGVVTKVSVTRASSGGALTFQGAYDRAGTLVRQDLPGQVTATTKTNVLGQETGLSYTGQITPVTATTDPDTGETTWTPGTPTRGDWLAWTVDRDGQGRIAREFTAAGAAFNPPLGDPEPGDTGTQPVGPAQAYDRAYTYDGAGRLTKVVDRSAMLGLGPITPATPVSAEIPCQVREYGFNGDAGRNGARTSWTMSYHTDGDCAGTSNVITGTAAHSYDSADRLTTGVSLNGAAPTGSYAYDQFGRQTTIPASDAPNSAAGNITLGYYVDDLPQKVAQGGASTEFTLDSAGRRATQTTTQGATTTDETVRHYSDDSDNPAWISKDTGDGSPPQVTRFVDGLTSELGGMVTDTGEATINLSNPHGDNVASVVIGATASAAEACAGIAGWSGNSEYGGPPMGGNTGNASVVGPIGYGWLGTAQRSTTTETAGLTLMGVRYYNWVSGAFTSPDPIPGGNDTSYGYPNDPVNESDISGEFSAFKGISSGGRGGGMAAYSRYSGGGGRAARPQATPRAPVKTRIQRSYPGREYVAKTYRYNGRVVSGVYKSRRKPQRYYGYHVQFARRGTWKWGITKNRDMSRISKGVRDCRRHSMPRCRGKFVVQFNSWTAARLWERGMAIRYLRRTGDLPPGMRHGR